MTRSATVPAGRPGRAAPTAPGTTAVPAPVQDRRADRIRTIAVTAAVAVLIVAAAFLLDSSPASAFTKVNLTGDTSGARPEVGQVIPDLSAVDVDGHAVKLSDLRGKGVWLTFGATWCVDCRAEAPDLEATAKKFRDRGLVVVGVFLQEDATAIKSYASRVGFDFTMVPDPTTALASRFKILGLPTHYFIGPDGVIKEIRLGGLPVAEMEKLTQEILPS